MFHPEKFKALVHLAIARVADPKQLGATKLNKIAWFVDGNMFLRKGESLTGARYVKMPQGPVPKAMLPILRQLQQDGAIRIDEVAYFGRMQRQFVSLQPPNAQLFTEDELSLIHDVTDVIATRHTAKSISDATHGVAWKLAEMDEELPFFAVLADDLGKVTEADLVWARERMTPQTVIAA